jgi:hypothetical protein
MDIFRTMIVPDANVALARAIAVSFGPGGENMWISELSPTGDAPATHYISTGYVPLEYQYLVPSQTWEWVQPEGEAGEWVMTGSTPGDPVALYTHASNSGVECTQADVDALFVAADVTEQPWPVAVERLGLQPVRSEFS